MRLLLKLNVILIVAFALVWVVQDKLSSDAAVKRNQARIVDGEAQLMIHEALAVRKYTEDQIQPLVQLRRHAEFHSQWVPFYAASQVFKNLKQEDRYKDYDYREAAINPTNPNDRADGWESNVIRQFQLNHNLQTWTGERQDIGHYAVVNAIPVARGCLECHGNPSDAPPEMRKKYTSTLNGFGWKEGDIAGAQIIYVPTAQSASFIREQHDSLTINRLGFFFTMLVIVNLAVVIAVIRPLNQLAKNADALSKEHYDIDELDTRTIGGRDEVSDLAQSFNRLHRSVKIAMRKAEGRARP